MNRGIFEGMQGRFAVLGHTNVVADADGIGLPDLPNERRLRRILLRPTGNITFTLDGSDPTAPAAMYALKDEIIVLDCAGDFVQLAGGDVDVKVIYFGT